MQIVCQGMGQVIRLTFDVKCHQHCFHWVFSSALCPYVSIELCCWCVWVIDAVEVNPVSHFHIMLQSCAANALIATLFFFFFFFLISKAALLGLERRGWGLPGRPCKDEEMTGNRCCQRCLLGDYRCVLCPQSDLHGEIGWRQPSVQAGPRLSMNRFPWSLEILVGGTI